MKPFNSFLGFTAEEIHAFIIGFSEILCPWPAQHKLTHEAEFSPSKEYHYYLAGRASGFITLMLILITLAKLGKELLL